MLNIRPKFKKEDFFFDQKEKKVFLLVVRIAAVTVGCALILLLIFGGIIGAVRAVSGEKRPAAAETVIEIHEEAKTPATRNQRLTLNDFILPSITEKMYETEMELYRERTGRWDDDTIEKFWVPPTRIGLEKLRELNDKNIERLFEDVQ
jgi:hypothetical protein